MDLNKHIITNENSNPLHSSGFAIVASGDKLGVTSAVSFNQRQQIDRNRRVVDGYQRSTLGNAYGVLRVKPVADKEDLTRKNLKVPKRPTLQQHNAASPAVRQFTEPTPRGYNPYA